jgi:hypothetical protein
LASHKLPIPCKIIAKTTEEVGEWN